MLYKLLKIKIYIKLFEIVNILIDLLEGNKTNIGDPGNTNNIPSNIKWYTIYKLSPNLIRNLSHLIPDDLNLIDSNIALLLLVSTNIVFYLYLLKIKYYEKENKEKISNEDSNDDENMIE